MLGIRVNEDDLARLDAVVSKLMLGSRHAVARAALQLGLDAIERDPSVLLGGGVAWDKATKPRKP
jgi:hypothetical protein